MTRSGITLGTVTFYNPFGDKPWATQENSFPEIGTGFQICCKAKVCSPDGSKPPAQSTAPDVTYGASKHMSVGYGGSGFCVNPEIGLSFFQNNVRGVF